MEGCTRESWVLGIAERGVKRREREGYSRSSILCFILRQLLEKIRDPIGWTPKPSGEQPILF